MRPRNFILAKRVGASEVKAGSKDRDDRYTMLFKKKREIGS
jgi:hypothetical protein